MKGVAVRRISETERFPTNIETAREHQHTVDVKGVSTVKQAFWPTLLEVA